MELILLLIQLGLALGIIIVVLMQRSQSDGFGMGSGSGTGLLSGRAKANALTKTTGILAAAFMLNSLVFSYITVNGNSTSLIDQIPVSASTHEADVTVDAEDVTPVVPLMQDAPVAAEAPEVNLPQTEAVPTDGAQPVTAPQDAPQTEVPLVD